jgi:hypothetical protein
LLFHGASIPGRCDRNPGRGTGPGWS